jgi:hypothetical protein
MLQYQLIIIFSDLIMEIIPLNRDGAIAASKAVLDIRQQLIDGSITPDEVERLIGAIPPGDIERLNQLSRAAKETNHQAHCDLTALRLGDEIPSRLIQFPDQSE